MMASGRVRAVQDLRRSGAAGPHDSDLPRGEEKRQAIGEQMDDVDDLGKEGGEHLVRLHHLR